MGKQTDTPDLVNVELLHYKFRFKKLTWREEMAIHVDKDKDPLRDILSYALVQVSGLLPVSIEESKKVIAAIPEPIMTRVWKVYRGLLPPAKKFSTIDLYQAPKPSAFMGKVMEDDNKEESTHDKMVREMEARFGKAEVADEAELSRRLLEQARKERRIFEKATPDG